MSYLLWKIGTRLSATLEYKFQIKENTEKEWSWLGSLCHTVHTNCCCLSEPLFVLETPQQSPHTTSFTAHSNWPSHVFTGYLGNRGIDNQQHSTTPLISTLGLESTASQVKGGWACVLFSCKPVCELQSNTVPLFVTPDRTQCWNHISIYIYLFLSLPLI